MFETQKTKFNKALTLGAVSVLAGAGIGIKEINRSSDNGRPNTEVVTVKSGDTIYSLVDRAENSNEVDIRPEVDRIEHQLGTTTINPGQKIVIHTRE